MPVLLRKNLEVHQRISRNVWLLGSMLVLGGLFIGWITWFGTLTGSPRLAGTLGILLGLYICSHPAANMLDILLFMSPDIRESLVSSTSGRVWLFLNLLDFFAAWAVIFTAVLRFVSGSI